MKRSWLAAFVLLLFAPPLDAQAPATSARATAQLDHAAAASESMVESVAPLYGMVKHWLLAAARQMPEDLYDYRPTAEVRSFGELLGHVANAHYMFCGLAIGESGAGGENFEERTTRAGLIEALEGSFAYCDDLYTGDDEWASGTVTLFGQERSRLHVLIFNAAHDWEHYGNIVTYMRMNDMVPPSSQQN